MLSTLKAKVAAVVLAASCVTGVALAPPASASGGGCGSYGSGGGATFKSCISQSGNYINFDGYVYASSSCYAHVTLFRDGYAVYTGQDYNCRGSFVHIPGGSWYTQSGHTWFSEIFVHTNGNWLRVSPKLYT
jgi:hypothetical protein